MPSLLILIVRNFELLAQFSAAQCLCIFAWWRHCYVEEVAEPTLYQTRWHYRCLYLNHRWYQMKYHFGVTILKDEKQRFKSTT